jgi:hypothetical protein
MGKMLELAISKAATLPEEQQEALGRDLLRRIDAMAELRADIEEGLAQLNAGLGRELDLDAFLKRMHEEHARKS